MSQQNVLDFLLAMRDENDDWYMVKDIKDGMEQIGFSNGALKGVSDDLVALASCGDIEWRGIGIWNHRKEFRARTKCLGEK